MPAGSGALIQFPDKSALGFPLLPTALKIKLNLRKLDFHTLLGKTSVVRCDRVSHLACDPSVDSQLCSKAFPQPLPPSIPSLPLCSSPPATLLPSVAPTCNRAPLHALPPPCNAFSSLLSYQTPPHPLEPSPCITSSRKPSLTPAWANFSSCWLGLGHC